ncbi:Hypothetical protein PBC10988_24280 [Planctomycetales bacterium 10988]|nr:Hypothetical protein PBC10988_24280 [Planctomycetales bacterium 10988]
MVEGNRLPSCAARWLLLALCLGVLAGCARYRIGNQSLYRSDLRTIYVPMFQSDSYRKYLSERLYEAVLKEIELKTPYKVVNSPLADSTLEVRLINDVKRVTIFSPTDEARELEIQFSVEAVWTDRCGITLQESGPLPFVPARALKAESTKFRPEAGQSMATAQQETIDRLAQQIVALLEAPW